MEIIGIDIGKKGGICVLNKRNKNVKNIITMPLLSNGEVDSIKIFNILKDIKGYKHCYIEKLHSMPIFGAKGNFSFGGHYHTVKSILRLSKTPFTEVSAKTWQKFIFQDIKKIKKSDGKTDTKKMAKVRALDLEEKSKFMPTKRSKTPHDGLIDAYLIAYYGTKI